METIFMSTKNSNARKLHESALNLSQQLVLRSPSKHVAFQYLSIYYTIDIDIYYTKYKTTLKKIN